MYRTEHFECSDCCHHQTLGYPESDTIAKPAPDAERELAAERLQRIQSLARMAARLSRVGAWSVELPSLKQTWSDEVCAIHEMPPGTAPTVEEAINYYAPECREIIAEAFEACVRDGRPFDVELQLITAKGQRVWVRSIGEADYDAAGVIRRVQGAFQDISERKTAEAETRELAERLTTTLESLTDGFFTVDREWRFTFINGGAEQMFKLPRSELLGQHIWSKIPEALGTVSHRQYERAVRDNVPVQFETFYPPLDIWFDVRAFPSSHGLAVYFRDITEVRQAVEALRQSEERFAAAFEQAPIGVALVSPEGRWLKVNRALCDLVGYSEAELLVRTFQDITHPEDLEIDLEYSRKLIAGEIGSYQMEKRYVHARGHFVTVLLTVSLVRDGRDQPSYFISQIQDITGRKESDLARMQTENALRESNEKFLLMADNITDAFWIRSPDMREVHYISPAFERIWGRPAKSLHANPNEWESFVLLEDRDRVRLLFAELKNDTPSLDVEYRIVRPDGEIRWIRARGFQVRDAEGKLIRLTGIVTDITERMRAAVALQTSHEELSRTNQALQTEIVERKRAEDAAEAANRSKSEFLANMSHEIRTPLNGVVGMTELALGTDLNAEQREYLDMVKSSGESLLTVIDDILDFSKIEAGRLTVDIIPFDLRDCLTTTLRMFDSRAHLKGLELSCDFSPGVPTAVVGDPARLRQIVTNLIGNAIKFTAHGKVALTVETQSQTDRDTILQFSVSDTGIGVPREKQAEIFKPFIQADGSTTRTYGGTGLGLAISTNLVALMGGQIWLESETGSGSTFHFTIRFDLQDASIAATTTVTRHSLTENARKLRILLAEDNLVNQLVAARLLEKRGHIVVIAGNGKEALAALEDPGAGEFDLILMDVQMPEMGGFEATAIIRAREKTSGAHLPIVAMTANAMKGDEEQCLAAGMDGYVSKPIHVERLFATIEGVLHH